MLRCKSGGLLGVWGMENMKPSASAHDLIREIERHYSHSVVGVQGRFAAWVKPPVDFINRELERSGAGWRVRETGGRRSIELASKAS
jgi:hypothetical protein